ncbi:hypothetical protein [Brevibacillus reuszeri]|uniref:hypothetical protein n=1 Tax=Brevibacillus reuszeri TaxID=54915 RepID=UPI0013E0453E|nr:hypothetical protein [Brevibacillus reuszeri]
MTNNNQSSHSDAPQPGGLRIAANSGLKIARKVPTISYAFADGSLSKWDVPTWQVKLIETRHRFALARYAVQAKHTGVLTSTEHQILVTTALAKSLTEDQFRRACKPLTNSTINKRLDRLEKYGLVERRKFTGERDPEQNYPGIITLTDTGKDYIRLTEPGMHCMGSSDFLRSPNLPVNLIASNEIKLQLIENDALISWQDHPQISTFGKVACSAQIALSDGPFHLVMERISGMQKVDRFLTQRLEQLSAFAQRGEHLLEDDFALVFIVPSDSSIQQLIEAYQIHTFANTYKEYYRYVWFISHERLFSPLGFQHGLVGIGKNSISPRTLEYGNADDY